MDERHWWIAGKIQESFHIGGFDNPTLLEDFMSKPQTLDLINQFLSPGGLSRLFLYCERAETSAVSTRQLHVTGTLSTLVNVDLENVTILYFLKRDTEHAVDSSHMERDIFCGELKGNTVENLNSVLSDIYLPLIKAQKEWGQCTQENQASLLSSLEKTVTNLTESSVSSHSSKHVMLKQPENIVGSEFKQHRLAALDQTIINEYEDLVCDWISTIEAILHDTADERFMDPNAGPLSELDRWKRRQRLLVSITEQLKGKECKVVIGVLITAKSRLLKKWKLVDVGITDALNETKDKVRYLESLKRHFDQLYSGATPASIINSALPGLINTVKQMDSVSRFYARQGYLGLLFTKVTNQIVLACKEYIERCTISPDNEDLLWQQVELEIMCRDSSSGPDPQQKYLQSQIESKLKMKKRTNGNSQDEGLFARLKSCLALQSYYRDSIRSLRDALGASHNLSHFTSLSSLGPATSTAGGRSKVTNSGTQGTSKHTGRSSVSTTGSPVKGKTSSVSGSDHEGHGVSVADEETIMNHLDAFCSRLRQILDVINTMTQFYKLQKITHELPRPRKEDLVCDEKEEKHSQETVAEEHVKVAVQTPQADGNLDVITEDEERVIEKADQQRRIDTTNITEMLNSLRGGLSKRDVDLLLKYYPENQRDDGPSVSSIVDEHSKSMAASMTESVTSKTMLDVESKDKDRFEEIYATFLQMVQNLERFLAAYLNAIFVRRMKTHEALKLMTKFVHVQQRAGIRVVISEKFVEIFNWYENDLEEIQQLYERHKDEPPLLRNAPPVAGAISWSRQLLMRIEEPMKVFRDNKAVTNLKDFGRIVKMYNRLATALVTFESLWFTHWKTSIDHAKNGLRATLFVHHPETKEIMVNADEKVLEVIHEAKWLTRLGIQIPEAARHIMLQESRFKGYKDHLNLCLTELSEVIDSIPVTLKDLFQSHIDQTLQNFQPGLSTLAWNSMNIDAFLHQIHAGTTKLRFLVEQVHDIMTNKVEQAIRNIQRMFFFDFKMAFARSWPPEEFVRVIGESIKLQSQQLSDYITTIEVGIKECANILTGKKSAPEGTNREKTSLENLSGTLNRMSKEEEKTIQNLFDTYCDQIYAAILLATTHSLVTLAEACGCEGEAVRAASALSEQMSCASLQLSSTPSRVTSAANSTKSRPVSVLSMLSNMSWTTKKTHDVTHLRFEVLVKFSIPNIIIEPALDSVQEALNQVASEILNVPRGVTWCGADHLGEDFLEKVQSDEVVDEIMLQISQVVDDLQSVVKQHIFHFGMYDFLWKDDMYGSYYDFIQHDPGTLAVNKEVERLLKVEKKVQAIPEILSVGPVALHTNPMRDALHGFAMAWKTQYASVLHEEAKRKLDAALLYRSNVRQRLELVVSNLDQLNSTLHLLEEVRDMENKIDDIYLPIENMYANLREFELRLPRTEVEEVDQLRENWQDLLELAEEVRQVLLKERREAFEQELDKQVKTFVVEVIQFRNAFDAQGPAVPGIPPSEAVSRLQDFLSRYTLYEAKRKTLDSVSKLFGIPCKPFPELDKTGEELELLGMLYGLFQKFIRFDEQFRDTLWAEVDLEASTTEVESYWDECLALPSKLKDWDACNDMKSSIQQYRDVFPLLHKLASKGDTKYDIVEIRNRHWLQVMSVTGSSFQLEANVFKLSHLLDIGLIKHRMEIEEICRSASRELELEVKLRMTEEEWTEQVLNFEHYKKRGPMYLDKPSTERLLEQLEDAQALLAQMLTSRYIGPLREEAASWAEKLKEVGQVLEQWLEVQDMWQFLEAVFSSEATAKELPQEAKRFNRTDKGWTKMMKRAYDTRNVLQCCYGEEVPKGVVLRHIYVELEICFKSLTGYLDSKRRVFPRFYFVSDPILLAILSRPSDLESVKPHLRSLFSAIAGVRLEKQRLESDSDSEAAGDVISRDGKRSSLSAKTHTSTGMSPHITTDTPPPKIDKRLTAVHRGGSGGELHKNRSKNGRLNSRQNMNPSIASQYVSTMLPSELAMEEATTMEATAVTGPDGEILLLNDRVSLVDGVEVWLETLQKTVSSTLHEQLLNIITDINGGMSCDEWPSRYPTQVCRAGMLYYWTRECEQGVSDIKYDRKSLNGTSKKFGQATSKLSSALTRGTWRSGDDNMQSLYRTRLENLITQAMFLRDTIDYMANRKIRENTDFEWRRNVRLYVHDIDDKPEPLMFILEQQYRYGCEFYGAQPVIASSPLVDKCFLSMSQAISQFKGSLVTGTTAAGKTETIKAFAQTMGQFLFLYQCEPHSDPSAVTRALHGMSMDGCWGCFDDVEKLNTEGMSVLVDHIQAVLGALKARANYCFSGDGQEIPVNRNTGFFMTYKPMESASLPSDLRALFRRVNVIRPDLSLVLKAKCSQLGMKSPQVLALRLKLVTELTRDQLSDNQQHSISVASLTGVLQRVAQRRRLMKDDKGNIPERLEKKHSDMEGSRSNSVMSASANNFPLQQSSSTLMNPQQTNQKGRKQGTPNPLSPSAKVEHASVGQYLLDMIGPRLSQENYAIFRQIVKDVFSGLPDPPGNSSMATARSLDVEAALETTALEGGIIPHKLWREKCLQLYSISQVHQGIIVAGPPGSGKSTIVQCLVDALCATPRGLSRSSNRTRTSDVSETNHKLQKIFPLVVDDLSLVFGYLNQNHDWVDGILTSAWRKACRNQSTTWLCLDGPLKPTWVDHFSSALDSSKMLHLGNGDQLPLSNNVKLLFETDDLSEASPSLVSRSGIVFVDKNVVGWRPIAKAWLENRSQQEVHVLQRAFDKTVDPVSHFVMNECKPKVRLSEVGMFNTCINLLSAMLADNIEIGGELHIERLYLFCLMWSFGGLLEERDKKGFNDLLATLSTALPDDDRDVCFFDYYVDESGEWDPWQSRVPEVVYTDHQDLLGEVFVDTVDTIRTRLLMEFASASGLNVLLVGPSGSGKTSMINDFLDTQDPQLQVSTKLVYSSSSTAKQLQTYIESNVYHRQGFVYGAKENKRLQIFIDDLNLPRPDADGVQHCNECLRRMLDDGTLCTLQKPFEWRTVEGLSILSAMSISDAPSHVPRELSPRLLRHFAVLNLPAPQEESTKAIVHGILEANMYQQEHTGLDIELHQQIVSASCDLLSAVRSVLRPTPSPGRKHYLFTLRDLVTCFQCVRRLADESRADEKMVVSLWKHEMERVMRDRICRYADLAWFDEKLSGIVQERWPGVSESLHPYFVTFPVDARLYQRPVTSMSKKDIRVMLQPIEGLKEVHSCLQTHLSRYNEEFGNIRLDIMLSDNIISHLVRMHRVLSYHHGGNFLLVGPIGSHLGTLVKLTLHVADIPLHPIDSSKQNNFFDGLRSAVRLTGAEGKKLTLFFTGRDLKDPLYLDAINSLLIAGEYPHLFTNDEMEGLLQAVGPAMKREHPNTTVDPAKFFVSRVKTNLHIVVCLPPKHELLSLAASEFPGLISGCQLIWMCDWTKESLLGEAAYYLSRYNLTKDCQADLSENVMTIMANIHSFILQECRQSKWAGDTSEEISLNEVKINEKKKDQIKITPRKMPNRPYTKAIMLENIRLRHRDINQPTASELFIGPTFYRRLMDTFRHIYIEKASTRTEHVNKLKKVLATIDQTRKDARSMKESIRSITQSYETAKEKTAELLQKLTGKATSLEKLKAKVGIATSLSAFLQLNELSDEEDDDDDLLREDERDEYDDEFDKMRAANLKTRQVQAKEEHVDAVKMVEQCRAKLAHAREQVLYWKSKVDRQCIERLKNFQNPPMLVGHVMEMVMTLIGKRLPSQRLEVGKDHYPSKEEQSGRFSNSSSSTKLTSQTQQKKGHPGRPPARTPPALRGRGSGKTGKEGSERFDRQQWKSMQLTMNDATKFVDMMHNVPWEDGLSADVVAAVESYLAKGRDGELGVTGEGTMLENAPEKEKGLVAQRRSPSPDNTKGITLAAAKYSSEDAATLVNYTIAIVEYTRLCGPLKAALERVHELEREMEENERIQREKESHPDDEANKDPRTPSPEEDLSEDDLPQLQNEVNDLQAEFDAAVVEKHSLEQELSSMRERLKAATFMVESLKPQESEWRQYVTEHCNNDMLVANCICSSALLTYCGGMNTDTRRRFAEFFMTICEHHGMPLPPSKLFRNMELVEFLQSPLTVYEFEEMVLPTTPLMLENATFLLQGDAVMAWPLICDPCSRIINWLQAFLQDKGLVQVRYSDLRSQFDNCLADGLPLLITDVDVNEFTSDTRFHNVILARHRFIPGQNPFKIQVGDHEVECQPHFRMYLHTTTPPHLIPPELSAYVSLTYFHQTRGDVEEELLDRFMSKEKGRLYEEKRALLTERLDNMRNLRQLETQMVNLLSSDVRLVNDLQTTKKLAELKKQHEETQENQMRVEAGEVAITRAKEGFRTIAKRGGVCFDTMQYMREVSSFYQVSFSQYLDLFDAAISHSDRASIKAVVDRLMHSAFIATARSLMERDKPIYSLLLALEVEDAEGRVGPGEREYLISPSLGSVTMTALGHTQPPDSKFVTAKKTFDWMTEEQFNNLQILAIHYDWFQDMFDRMPKDGRETQWRNLCESDMPETQPLPDRMDDQFTALQRMLIIRAVRSDRVNHLATLFIHQVLGKKWTGEVSLDMNLVLRQSSALTPILLLHHTEQETAGKLIAEFATKKQSKTLLVPLSGNSPGEEKMARKYISKAMAEGLWVILQNGHNQPHLLNAIQPLLVEQESVDPQFRCWVTAQATDAIPGPVLQSSIKVMVDTPRTVKEQLVRAFSLMDTDILRQSSKSEWPVVLHNLCYLHGALRLRARYSRGGFNSHSDFLNIGNNELFESLRLAQEEFRENITVISQDGAPMPRTTSWTGLRCMLAEVIYGNYVTDPLDQQTLTGMIDYWISPNAVKRDFELPRLKYKHPAVFLSAHPRMTQLIQALENLGNHFLETPEAANLHPSSETLLGDEQYIFTRLNKIYDAMPSSDSLSHDLFPRSPTPFIGPPISNISMNSNNAQVVDMGVFASSSLATQRMRKEVELWEVCNTMLPRVPKAYSKDYITERIKKIGGFTSFNMFLMKELDMMYRLLIDIKTSLTAIKAACELNQMGDQLTPTFLEIADDLYHLRIPKHWCQLSGHTTPPPNQALGTWLTDLSNRCQHFERILVLGREKMPAYWLGAFSYPRGLLALLKQDCYRHHASDRSGNIEQYVFQTEVTARDKDHIRDPPAEGMFVFGIYLWGCAWEKTNGDLIDIPPRSTCSALPVIHLTCWPQGEKPILQDPTRATEVYPCPVYQSRIAPRIPIMEIDVSHTGVPFTRWALRSLSATIRPY